MSRTKTPSSPRAHARSQLNPSATASTGRLPTSKKLNTIICFLLAATTIALYSPVIRHPFLLMDDSDYVTSNQHVHGGLSWSTIQWAFTSTEVTHWHPLTWLSHAFDYQLFALNPAGHHFDSVLIHALNAVLVFVFLVWSTKRAGPSLLVAALFSVHPINVESVAWVAERKNVLSTFFFLSAIVAYVWYTRKPSWRRYLPVFALFAAGLMAKSMVITLPFVLLLLDYWPLERMALDKEESGSSGLASASNGVSRVRLTRLVIEKIPLLLLCPASAWITEKAQSTATGAVLLQHYPIPLRIENAIASYGLYLWKMLWPAKLALYPHRVIALPTWQWTLSALVLICVTAFVVIFSRYSPRKRYLPVGWFWFLGTLIPVIGLAPLAGDIDMADRFAYIPLIGIFVMIAFGLADLADAKKVPPAGRVISAVCVLVALGCVSILQMSYWDSEYHLWSHSLAVAENPVPHTVMGWLLMNPKAELTQRDLDSFGAGQSRTDEARQQFESALSDYRQVVQQNPSAHLPHMASAMASTLNNLGSIDRLQNRPAEAREYHEEALKDYRKLAQQDPDKYLPDVAETLTLLGLLNRNQNRIEESRADYEEALTLFRELSAGDRKYARDVAATQAKLKELEKDDSSR